MLITMRDEPGTVPPIVAGLAGVAAVTYSSWVLGFLFRPELDWVDGYVSELSAGDQPLNWVFGGGDLVTGVLMIFVACVALMRLERRPWAVAGWVALVSFGVWAIGDALFDMDCAPSLDTTCALRERAGLLSFSHTFHSVTSTGVISSGVVSLLCLSIAARRYDWWPAMARWGWLLALIETAAAAGTVFLLWKGFGGGLVQRLQITVLCAGLFVIAWTLRPERAK